LASDLNNWWVAKGRLHTCTGAQIKPEAVTKYVEQMQRLALAMESIIQRRHAQLRDARRIQGLPHTPKLDPTMVPTATFHFEFPDEDLQPLPTTATTNDLPTLTKAKQNVSRRIKKP
jgi:hypothetical protein